MSVDERNELAALVTWMQTFPQLEDFTKDKENDNAFDLLEDPNISSSIFDVALEISNIDCDETTMSHSSDIWDNIISLTRKTSKRKSIELPSSNQSNWEDLSKHSALTNLLDGAVSHPNIELRTAYIGRIMKLPAETQRSLMALIERGKKQGETGGRNKKKAKTAHTSTDGNTSTPAKNRTTPRMNNSIRKPGRSSTRSPFSPVHPRNSHSGTPASNGRALFLTPRRNGGVSNETPMTLNKSGGRPSGSDSFFSPGLGDTVEYEKEVQSLREEKDQLLLANESFRRKEEDLTRKMEEMQTNLRNEMMKVETTSRRREEESREELQRKINDLECTLEKMSVQSEQGEQAKEELAQLKDEMELMNHTKSMLDETTERLNHYKEKLQHFTDVKEALQREEEAHGRSVDENLRLQNELNILQPLKRQLEEYKCRVVEAEVRLTDTQDELLKLQKKRQDNSDTHENLERTVQSQQEEIEALRGRLKQEEEAEASGLGEGISELNPEVKEELLRLRNENIQLKAFAEKREDDAVAKLEQNVEDSNRLCERYKSQFLSTKGQLETTQEDLKASLGREQNLEGRLNETKQVLQSTQSELQDTDQRLTKCNSDLESSKQREAKLEAELASWVDQSKILQERADDLSSRAQKCNNDLNDALGRESSLEESVAHWTVKFEVCSERALSLEHQLEERSQELVLSQEREVSLSQDVSSWSEKVTEVSERNESLSEQLKSCSEQLVDSQQRESELQNDLLEVRDKLETQEEEAQRLNGEISRLEGEFAIAMENLTSADVKQVVLQKELSDTRSHLETSIQSLNDELGSAYSRAMTAENLAEWLQTELSDAREALSENQDHEKTLSDQLEIATHLMEQSTHLMYGLEDDLDTEQEARVKAEEELEATRKENAKMEEELNYHVNEVKRQLEEEIARVKKDFTQSQEALNAAESSLGAAQHREKMLQHKLAMLEDGEKELKAEIEAERMKANHEVEETTKSLEATREALNCKARKDLDDLQNNMNQLLEDERKAKRQTEEACQQRIKQLREDFNKETLNLRENAANEIEAAKNVATELTERLKKDYEEKIENIKQEADDESTKLVRKGKGMLKELKSKQQDETDKLKDEIAAYEEKYSVVKRQKESMAMQYKTKATEYKKKLHFASGRINRLSAESDEYEEKVKALEREKFKLREENDRYRKQLGGRFGSESNGQVELLQKELENACDEIRELKRQQRSGGNLSSGLASIDESTESDQSYSRDVANHSTISQLRSEYEETIQTLVSDKRELVMRNSAAITDVQKAEQRAWEAEQENSNLKQELTSLQLKVERFESTDFDHAAKLDGAKTVSCKQDETIEIRSVMSPSQESIPNENLSTSNSASPLPFGLGQSSSGEDQPPECQQS